MLSRFQAFTLFTSCLTYFYAMATADDTADKKDRGIQGVLVALLTLGVFGCPVIGVFYLYGYKLIARMQSVQRFWRRLTGRDMAAQLTTAYACLYPLNCPALWYLLFLD